MNPRKSKKTTSGKQFDIMVTYLEQHPEMLGYQPGTAEASLDRQQLWSRLSETLNDNGPPTRTRAEWKSIWSDYKYNIKRKLAADHKLARDKLHEKRLYFSSIENRVIKMVNLKEKLYGKDSNSSCNHQSEVVWCRDFRSAGETQQESPMSEEENEESIVICSDYENEFVTDFNSPSDEHEPSRADEILSAHKEDEEAMKCDVTLMLKDTLEGMQKTQLEILKQLKEYNQHKKDTRCIKELQLQLEREKFEEQKKQNLETNKRACMELDIKRRELELYEMKLKGSCVSCVVKTEIVEQ